MHELNKHTYTHVQMKLGDLNEICILHGGGYTDCHVALEFCKLLPLGKIGRKAAWISVAYFL